MINILSCPCLIQSLVKIVKVCYGLIVIAVPIGLILMGMIDFTRAVIAKDDGEIKKAQGMFIKRIIAAVLVFFVLTIVDFTVDLISKYTSSSNWFDCWSNPEAQCYNLTDGGTSGGSNNNDDDNEPIDEETVASIEVIEYRACSNDNTLGNRYLHIKVNSPHAIYYNVEEGEVIAMNKMTENKLTFSANTPPGGIFFLSMSEAEFNTDVHYVFSFNGGNRICFEPPDTYEKAYSICLTGAQLGNPVSAEDEDGKCNLDFTK